MTGEVQWLKLHTHSAKLGFKATKNIEDFENDSSKKDRVLSTRDNDIKNQPSKLTPALWWLRCKSGTTTLRVHGSM